jgi:secreted PhoX family phosphatase
MAALAAASGEAWAQLVAWRPPAFRAIAPSGADGLAVADGYSTRVVARWGDPLLASAPALDPARVAAGSLLEPGAAVAQAQQFGYNCDGVGIFELGARRSLVCVNHEFPVGALMFPGMREALRARRAGEFVAAHPQCVDFMQAAVGVSIVELDGAKDWQPRVESAFNRRVTARTPMHMSGPARGHRLLRDRTDPEGALASGTLANCAAGSTPWGTYLTAEENIDEYFGNAGAARFGEALAGAHRRLPLRRRDSVHRWEYADRRFDVQRNPAEPLRFGWIVEIDPRDASRPIKKRTALGRFKHEAATCVVAPDGRVVVYMGDDAPFEYLYKFVTARPFDASRPERNVDLLDSGTLYVARFRDDGTGEWRPLVWAEQAALSPGSGFESQGDVVLRCREAADRLDATSLDRPEDIAVDPVSGKVYVSCTQNLSRGTGTVEMAGRRVDSSVDAVNPRAPNPSGHIVELAERNDDPASDEFSWDILLLAGNPAAGRFLTKLEFEADAALSADATFFGGHAASRVLSAFAGPDNLAFDGRGNLWIVTDAVQPDGRNNGCFVCPTAGPDRGAVRQFMSGPIGAEICGCEFTADGRTLFLTVQHPGYGGSATSPTSHWPDGSGNAPRPSLVAITPLDAGREFGA